MFSPGKLPADETQIAAGYIQANAEGATFPSALQRWPLMTCLSASPPLFGGRKIKKKKPLLYANSMWQPTTAGLLPGLDTGRHRNAGRARKKERGSGRGRGRGRGGRKSHAEEKESVGGAWCDACVMAMFTAAVSAQSPFGRMTTGTSSRSPWPARPICESVHVRARAWVFLATFWSAANICFIFSVCVCLSVAWRMCTCSRG